MMSVCVGEDDVGSEDVWIGSKAGVKMPHVEPSLFRLGLSPFKLQVPSVSSTHKTSNIVSMDL